MPQTLIDRAKEILLDVERDRDDLAPRVAAPVVAEILTPGGPLQLGLFEEREPTPLEKALGELDPDEMTPIDALMKLRELKDLL